MSKVIFDISPTGTGKTYVTKKVSRKFKLNDPFYGKENKVVLLIASLKSSCKAVSVASTFALSVSSAMPIPDKENNISDVKINFFIIA